MCIFILLTEPSLFFFNFFQILPGSARCDGQGRAVGKKRDGRQLCWIWSLSSNVLTFPNIWNNIVRIILWPRSQTHTHAHTHTHTHTHTMVSEILNSAVDGALVRTWGTVMGAEEGGLALSVPVTSQEILSTLAPLSPTWQDEMW